MAKIIPITEHFQHFLREMKESFWGDVYGRTTMVWKQLRVGFAAAAGPLRGARGVYQRRRSRRQPYRNGYYKRDFVTGFGTIRLRVARTRVKSFLPCGLELFQRRAEEVAMLIREAFLRGLSTRQAGRVVACTPPLLHNGSVPSLYQMLLPADRRDKTFYVGSRDFDPKNVSWSEHPDRGNRNTFPSIAPARGAIAVVASYTIRHVS